MVAVATEVFKHFRMGFDSQAKFCVKNRTTLSFSIQLKALGWVKCGQKKVLSMKVSLTFWTGFNALEDSQTNIFPNKQYLELCFVVLFLNAFLAELVCVN